MKQKKLKNRGITLIALIITIIVMLILVAVTVSVALNGGLISKAQEARTKTEEAQITERDLLTGRIKVGDTWYDSLDEYLKDNPSEDQSNEPSKWGQDKDGNITYEGEKSELKVGDYVDYETYVEASGNKTAEITTLYNDLTQYSGFTDDSNNAEKTYEVEYPIEKENTLKWRMLDIKDGRIRLISEKPTETTVYLYGYNGYNNAVYLIDKICSTLYTTEKGTAKNLKIEDIQDLMDTSVWNYEDYSDSLSTKFGETKEYTGSKIYYPAIFEKEKTGYIWNKEENKYVQGTELDLSEQTEPIKQDATIPENPTDDNKIKITHMFWSKKMEENNWKNAEYQNIFMRDENTGSDFGYVLSTRSLDNFVVVPCFDLWAVSESRITSFMVYASYQRFSKVPG